MEVLHDCYMTLGLNDTSINHWPANLVGLAGILLKVLK